MVATASLGIYYEIRVPPSPKDNPEEWGRKQRVLRYALLALVRGVLGDQVQTGDSKFKSKWRVNWCSRRLAWGKGTVDVYVMKAQPRAHYKNLAVCGSVWTCPLCASKISYKRGLELKEAIPAKDLSQAVMVDTIQHNFGSDLKTILDDLLEGVRFSFSGKPYQKFKAKWGIVGTVTGPEHTWSLKNGHHPHKNILFLSSLPSLDCQEFRDDLERIAERYKRQIAGKGYHVNEHTTKIITGRDDCSDYLTKWGAALEVTQGQQKEGHEGHYTPFQLLNEIGTCEDDRLKAIYIKAFRQYAECFKGKQQLVYSRGLRAYLGLGEEKTDEELAQEGEEPSWLLAQLSWDQYDPVLKRSKSGEQGRFLNFAASGDEKKFWDYLATLGVYPRPDQLGLQNGPTST